MKAKYNIEMKKFLELDDEVVVPKFQRRLVWSDREKREFIETLKNGYPFGSILIYEYEDRDENEKRYTLIDGLQRYSTIDEFKNNPQKYISFDSYVDEIMDLILEDKESLGNTLYREIRLEVVAIINKIIENREKIKVTYLFDELKKISSRFGVMKDMNTLMDRIMNEIQPNVLNEINRYSIDDIPIPTILFKGNQSELAKVFENLNRGGKKLSKYQVFAAQWSREEIYLSSGPNSKKLVEKVIDRYNLLNESRSVEIEDFDETEMREKRLINLPEFCYGLGELIIDEMHVFWSGMDEDLANTIGYSTIALVLDIKMRELHHIVEYVDVLRNEKFVENLIGDILAEYRIINNYFGQYLKYPGITTNRYESKNATNYQLLSYFITLWTNKYEKINITKIINGESNQNNKLNKYRVEYENVQKNFLKHYLHDLSMGYWTGTGDSKIDEIRENKGIRYKELLQRDYLENTLLRWWKERQQKYSINFDDFSKMLLVIHSNLNQANYKELEYDIDHVFARSTLSKVYKKGEGIAAGTLGNMMFLEKTSNRSKKEFSLYEVKNEGFSMDKDFISNRYYPSQGEFMEVKKEIQEGKFEFVMINKIIDRRGRDIINNLLYCLYE